MHRKRGRVRDSRDRKLHYIFHQSKFHFICESPQLLVVCFPIVHIFSFLYFYIYIFCIFCYVPLLYTYFFLDRILIFKLLFGYTKHDESELGAGGIREGRRCCSINKKILCVRFCVPFFRSPIHSFDICTYLYIFYRFTCARTIVLDCKKLLFSVTGFSGFTCGPVRSEQCSSDVSMLRSIRHPRPCSVRTSFEHWLPFMLFSIEIILPIFISSSLDKTNNPINVFACACIAFDSASKT